MPRLRRLRPLSDVPQPSAARERLLAYARRLVLLPAGGPEARALLGWIAQHAEGLRIMLPPLALRPTRTTGGVPRETWARLRDSLTEAGDPRGLTRPFRSLAEALELDPLSESILEIAADYRSNPAFMALWDALSVARGGEPMLSAAPHLFAALLGSPEAAVLDRLRPEAPLRGAGLLVIDEERQLSILPRLARLAAEPVARPDLRAALLGPAAVPSLSLAAFRHLGAGLERTVALLRGAVAARCPGVHVLLYGPPGTGKTCFAAALADAIGVPLHEVATEGDEGEELGGAERLAALRLAQRLLRTGQPAVLLLDEAEDIFEPGLPGVLRPRAERSRAFTHRLLETGPAPVIWTVNSPDALGPAVARRMACCLELRIPPIAVRERLWQEAAGAEGIALAPQDAAELARRLPAAPAVIRTASRAARLAGGGAETLRWAASGITTVMAGGRSPPPEPRAGRFDPALVNSDLDLPALAERLARPEAPRQVSLLLSGPPGTGKTAFACHLAERLDLPLLQRRGSDLLGPFVGETEQKIAAAFAEARAAGALLLFDEADGLLGDRAGARHSWEVSQVNEMLTWMEHHPLPVCCTTNLPERLDPAAMRRFLVKARFGWLSADQASRAWRDCFAAAPPAGLAALDRLTPADFALVRRAAELAGTLGEPAALLAALAREQQAKPAVSRPIGFRPLG